MRGNGYFSIITKTDVFKNFPDCYSSFGFEYKCISKSNAQDFVSIKIHYNNIATTYDLGSTENISKSDTWKSHVIKNINSSEITAIEIFIGLIDHTADQVDNGSLYIRDFFVTK